ncbi:NAD(P)/FAD-dependent oxidoreductase [Actinokineospora bangkokensis]|uniref:FAD dependent oxidoreductase domain-containing protein n=1 Tax=Actinokineospora bangkokensis TaxID=1193682 RepID=A0A1Q9LJS3_9PSEU|nr:FAD-dependent oxidoreductase [Actinokineospora bangkokensis]OLR92245.1 hypothetical protein BJP25_23285 [Actinokineospora bangkokensis]
MRVVTIGAGAIGTATALRLRQAGAEVVHVAATAPRDTLSAHSFSWANGIDEGSEAYWHLSLEALAAHRRLAAETDPAWLGTGGNLHWAADPAGEESLATAAKGYRALDYPVRELTTAQALELEPGLRLDDAVGPIRFYPDDVFLHTDLMLDAVARAATGLGVRQRFGEPVAGIAADGRGVRLASGEVVGADAVVCCAGRGNAELLAGLGITLPLLAPGSPRRLTHGLMVRTTPVEAGVRRVVHAPHLSIRPASGGALMLHCHDLDWLLNEGADPGELAERVVSRLPGVLPSAGGARVASYLAAVRPVPVDGMTIVGPVAEGSAVSVVATHSGVTLAAVLAEVVVGDLVGRPHPLADGFRLSRFG